MKTTKKANKKISEMSAEEFMEHGLASDEESEQEEEQQEMISKTKQKKKMDKVVKTKEKTKTKKPTTESSQHKEQMERLKDKDPEFFKFLQENDEDLLAFSGDEDDEETDDEKVDNGSDGEQQEDDGEESDVASGDSEDNEEDDDDDEVEDEIEEHVDEEPTGKMVTNEMVDKWKESVEGGSLKTLKTVFKAFHAAVETMSPEDDNNKEQKKKKQPFVIDGGVLFNRLVAICFKNAVNILEKQLNYAQTKKTKRVSLPTSSKQWSKVKPAVKQYLMDILQLLRQLTDPTVLTVTLRHCQILCPYYACFPKITKMLLKRLIRMWSSADEHVRVIAFLSIRKLTMLTPNLLEFTLKNLYLAFVRNSKFVNLKTKPTVMFMRNSLVEMFALNEVMTYKHAFVYIRQLAIHLRNAMTTKKKDGHQAVYNWQYISCLLLWVHTLSELYGETLKPLVYPVVQITLGVVRLIPSARYYPLRFQCLDALNYLSQKTDVYIPIASYVLEEKRTSQDIAVKVQAIESKEFLKKPKSSEKPPDFNGVLKLTKTQLQTKGCQDASIDRAFGCLLEHYVNLSSSIAFPELIFPICYRLKHLIKDSKVFKLNRDMKSLVDKEKDTSQDVNVKNQLNTHAGSVTKARSLVSFSPKDVELVRTWEEQQKAKKNVLTEFHETWKRMKTVTEINHDVEEDDEDEDIQPKKGKKKNVSKKRKAAENDDDVKDEKKSVSNKAKKSKKIVSNGERHQTNQEDDIVEDLQFSSDESDNDN